MYIAICPVGYDLIGEGIESQYCYKNIPQKLPWEDARKFCLLHNGDLATFHSEKEKEWMARGFDDHWLGYKYRHGKISYLQNIIQLISSYIPFCAYICN